MKVCFLVQEHPFLDARIFQKEAKSLLKQGYEVTMIVPRVKGCLFDISGKMFVDSFKSDIFTYEGIKIITYEQFYPHKNLKNLNYNIKSGSYHRFNDLLTKIGIEQEADIYHAHEFFSLYSGIGIKRTLHATKAKDIKLIYDSHELDPDPHTTNNQTTKIMIDMLQFMLKEVNYLITVSESIKAWYQNLSPNLPIEIIYNSPPLSPNLSFSKRNNDTFSAVYEGLIHKTKGNFNKLIEITEICNKEIDFKFRIIGGTKGIERDQLLVPSHLKDKIELLGWIDYTKLPLALSNVDLGWIDLEPEQSLNHRYAMPNKFFSYLNNGIPVLVNNCNDMKKFIESHQCGHVINKMKATSEDYADAIISLYRNKSTLKKMGINARKIMKDVYRWEEMEKRLFNIYNNL
ncbi:glycosyltransferase family 4 protein [Priestia megaterium]|uniref:glycosyltransferase family 4 protein n=1 Tax=Priestia megaterium TaxID=1404 RepID=UPI003D00EA75